MNSVGNCFIGRHFDSSVRHVQIVHLPWQRAHLSISSREASLACGEIVWNLHFVMFAFVIFKSEISTAPDAREFVRVWNDVSMTSSQYVKNNPIIPHPTIELRNFLCGRTETKYPHMSWFYEYVIYLSTIAQFEHFSHPWLTRSNFGLQSDKFLCHVINNRRGRCTPIRTKTCLNYITTNTE